MECWGFSIGYKCRLLESGCSSCESKGTSIYRKSFPCRENSGLDCSRFALWGLALGRTRINWWGVARTHHRQEQRAAYNVEKQDFEFYLPEFRNLNRRGTKDHRELLFPGFIFIKLRPDWDVLPSTRGIKQLFMCGLMPSRMRAEEIAAMKAREDEKGFISLSPKFSVGQAVTPQVGSYKGITGICEGMSAPDRCAIFFGEVLGNRLVAEIDVRHLEIPEPVKLTPTAKFVDIALGRVERLWNTRRRAAA